MESTGASLCYICSDKRRTAETDANQTTVNNKPYEDTFKETLLKAIACGIRDEDICENETEILPSSQKEFSTEILYKKVESDSSVFICRRCEGLLRDFDYHERQAYLIGETIRMFLTKQDNPKTDDSSCNSSSNVETVSKGKKRLDEKRGILAAFRAMRKSNNALRSRGRKRKEIKPSSEKMETSENEHMEDTNNSNFDVEGSSSVRLSKRIQRRREEGLVIRWGDVHGETVAFEAEPESHGCVEETFHPNVKPKRRGRKPNSTKLMRTSGEIDKIPGQQCETSLKYECPFCYRLYIPSLSRIHGCISYKNQLRCMVCNIFFTSYIRLEKHLEVIHLKQKELKCPESGCSFTCISHPALILHEHFHRLNEYEANSKVETSLCDETSGPSHIMVTAELNEGKEGITIVKHDLGSVCSPDTVEEVSFQLDEKTLVSGHSIAATVNSTKIKSLGTEQSLKGDSIEETLKCNICHVEFRSKKLYDEHMKKGSCVLQKNKSSNNMEITDEKNINYRYTLISMDSRKAQELFVKQQGIKETLTSGSYKDNIEINPIASKFSCLSCGKQFTVQKSLDEHVRKDHSSGSKITNLSKMNIGYTEGTHSYSERQHERPVKYTILSVDSRQNPEEAVKKNFNMSQAPT